MIQPRGCSVTRPSVAVGQAGSTQCCCELPIVKEVGVCTETCFDGKGHYDELCTKGQMMMTQIVQMERECPS